MSASDLLIHLAAALVPKERRELRREEWLADLAGADELGIPRMQVALGALQAAMSEGVRARRAGVTRRRVLATVAVVAGVVVIGAPTAAIGIAMANEARGVVTVEETDAGPREVFWKDYPGIPELSADEVLAGPTLEEGEAAGRELMAEIEAALTAEFGLDWAAPSTGNGDQVAFPAQNYYGGPSMLSTLNVQSRQSTSVPATWSEKERMLQIMAGIAARHGFTELSLDHDSENMTAADLTQSFGAVTPEESVIVSGMIEGPTGQWIMFTLQDLSLDQDGRFTEQADASAEYGSLPNSFSFMYGANGLLPEDDRAEFERRLEPYAGLDRPEPLES